MPSDLKSFKVFAYTDHPSHRHRCPSRSLFVPHVVLGTHRHLLGITRKHDVSAGVLQPAPCVVSVSQTRHTFFYIGPEWPRLISGTRYTRDCRAAVATTRRTRDGRDRVSRFRRMETRSLGLVVFLGQAFEQCCGHEEKLNLFRLI